MKKKKRLSFNILIIVSIMFFNLSCTKKKKIEKAPTVDADFAFKMVDDLVKIIPRGNGTSGTDKTVAFLKKHSEKYGATVTVDKWMDQTPEGKLQFQNVIATVKGQNPEFIVVGSHYDTKKLATVQDFQGANDSGSSTGLLLAMMKAIHESKKIPPYTLKFIFFDGEECFINYSETDGLFGSRHYVEKIMKNGEAKNCKAAIILDMIGDKDLLITPPADTTKFLFSKLMDVAKKQGKEKYFKKNSRSILDDHYPFAKANIPAMDIIDFEFGPNNQYWHTRADSIDKIDKNSLKIVGDVTLQLLWELYQ